MALACASLLVLKPLLVRYVPVCISDKPMTAREDMRRFSDFTDLFRAALDDMEQNMEEAKRGERRDTMTSRPTTSMEGPQ